MDVDEENVNKGKEKNESIEEEQGSEPTSKSQASIDSKSSNKQL